MTLRQLFWGCIVVGGVSVASGAKDLSLQVATLDHPHVRAIIDGRVKASGCSLHLTTATADALGQDLNGSKRYDVIEVDIVPFLIKQSAGELSDYVLIPVF